MAKKGDWVRIHSVVLTPDERSNAVPEDTKCVPLELWAKGYLLADTVLGEEVTRDHAHGRIVSGEAVERRSALYSQLWRLCAGAATGGRRSIRASSSEATEMTKDNSFPP